MVNKSRSMENYDQLPQCELKESNKTSIILVLTVKTKSLLSEFAKNNPR